MSLGAGIAIMGIWGGVAAMCFAWPPLGIIGALFAALATAAVAHSDKH
jgi:hypothetical protein